MNIQEALYLFEYVCWILASVAVAYPLIYSLASLGTRKSYYPTAHKQHKFVVLFPAYKEDRVIIPVVEFSCNNTTRKSCITWLSYRITCRIQQTNGWLNSRSHYSGRTMKTVRKRKH